ncbi:MAG: hypothetical protein K8963_10805, partial [Proteobacteria bacterium]|nr:hypothetical protein [Pseudomonadota bacterium]
MKTHEQGYANEAVQIMMQDQTNTAPNRGGARGGVIMCAAAWLVCMPASAVGASDNSVTHLHPPLAPLLAST